MNTDEVKRLPPRERLLYWVREREAVRLRREAGAPPPWTDDEILRTYRFCNVRRMDDRVSRWLLDNWYVPFRGHPNTVLAAVLARQLNNMDALEEVGFPEVWWPERVVEVLKARAARGLRNYSVAYMITANYGRRGRPRESKPFQTVHRVCTPLLRALADGPVPTDTMRGAWRALVGLPGLSSFMAGQVVADLRWALPGGWHDRLRWAPVGPGSARGLGRLLERPPQPADPDRWLAQFREHVLPLAGELPWETAGRLEAMDWQSCLCEFDKYERALWGEGRPKQLYKWGGA